MKIRIIIFWIKTYTYHGAQKRQFQLAIKMADRILYYLSSGSERYIFSIKQGRDIYYMLEA